MSKREFTFQDDKSDKFWNIEVVDESYTVTYGRSGTSGQIQSKAFDNETAATTAAAKLIAEKLKKGYTEGTSGSTTTASAALTSVPSTASPTAPAKAPKTPKAPVTEVAPEPAPKTAATRDTPFPSADEASADAPPFTPGQPAERELKLEPTDWFWATWRDLPPLPHPDAPQTPFNLEAAFKRLAKVPGKYDWQADWKKATISPVLPRAEARFWLEAIAQDRLTLYPNGNTKILSHDEARIQLEKQDLDAPLTVEDTVQILSKRQNSYGSAGAEHICLVLAHLFTPLEVLDILLRVEEALRAHHKGGRRYGLAEITNAAYGFRIHILPYLTGSERDALRDRLRPQLDLSQWPTDPYEQPNITFFLAAQLGLHDELCALVETWKDDLYSAANWVDHYHRPQEIIFGLGSAEEVNAHMRRLKLRINEPGYVRAWLAHTEYAQLDWVRDTILNLVGLASGTALGTKDEAELLTQNLAVAIASETAPIMLQLMLESKGSRPARVWLSSHPRQSAEGLLSVAAGRGKLAEAAIEWLRGLKKGGYATHLSALVAALPPTERARLTSTVIEYQEKTYQPFETIADAPPLVRDAILDDPQAREHNKVPISASELPPITYGDRCLSNEQVRVLLGTLQRSKPNEPQPIVSAVKATADPASLDTFAWKLFERWLSDGAEPKHKWAMLAVGHLGGDASALKLAPLIRAWPGEAQHQRAVTGLEVLRAIGTDTALMQINSIAQKVKFKGIQTRAAECMEGIAQDRNLSRAQLEDRVVPDCDLDEKGTRILDFGPRQFRFVLGPDMKPLVREEGVKGAKPRPDLPKPNAKDNANQAEAAVSEWKLMKKQIAEVAKVQAVRLENAMVTGRRWTPEEFEMLLAHHPLMTNLVRLLVWEAAAGNRRATFRLTEDDTYADSADETFDLAGGEWAHVGIVHPLHLSDEEKSAWGELFSDYELVPPFPQLGRTIYRLEDAELQDDTKEITRFANITVPPETLNFGLEKQGWHVGELHDHGDYYEHSKAFETAEITAFVQYEPGLFKGYRDGWEPQKIERCYFVAGSQRPRGWREYFDFFDKKNALPLSEIDPVAISETLKDLTEIAAKGEVKA